jgi:hypothetical protein
MSKKLTTEEFIKRAIEIHNKKFDYSFVEYKSRNKKVLIKCNTCLNDFEQTPNNHITNNQGCPWCINKRLNTKSFIDICKKKYGDKFDYTYTKYINSRIPIKIKCNTCFLFTYPTPSEHLHKASCSNCFNGKLTKENFLFRAKRKYGDKYDYSLVNFIDGTTKIKIKCNSCNSILNFTPREHLSKQGCQKCASNKRKLTTKEFIQKSDIIHGNVYSYSKVSYKKSSVGVIITCLKHGYFIQTPNNHLDGHGCPKCHKRISKNEIKFLNYLNIKDRQCYVNKFYFDGYDSNTKTVYEFLGDYWHGNPVIYNKNDINKLTKKTFGELYKNTIDRFKKIINNGFKLKYIWEKDWKEYQSGIVQKPKIKEYICEYEK